MLFDSTLDISIAIGTGGSFESAIFATSALTLECVAELNLKPEPILLVLPSLSTIAPSGAPSLERRLLRALSL